MARPSALPVWGTQTGTSVIGSLNINNINWQNTNIIRYTFSGSPDLSGVTAGHYLTATGCTNTLNNGTYQITEVNNASDWIEVRNTTRSSATDDEAASPGTGAVATNGAVKTEPSSVKKALGWFYREKPPEGYFNWWQNLVYLWIQHFDDFGTTIPTYADIATLTAVASTTFSNNAKVHVTGFGIYRYSLSSTDTADGETIISPDDVTGRFYLIVPDPAKILGEISPLISDIEYKLSSLKKTYARTQQLSGTVPSTDELDIIFSIESRIGDVVSVNPNTTFPAGLGVMGAWVSANNQVTVRIRNFSGSDILLNQEFRIMITRY